MRLITLPVCATALALAIASQAMARDYGQHGTVWPVVELDLLQQIHARLTQLEKTGETARLNEQLKRRSIARVNRPEPVAGRWFRQDFGVSSVERSTNATALY